jgi:outer membrane lipoprotein-sorting protein
MKKIFILLVAISFIVPGQTKNPDKILNEVKKNFDKIDDYSVDVTIKMDVSFLKVPDTKAKIYYKKPDKVNIESKQFALLPRRALDISPTSLLKGKYTAIFDKFETLNGVKTAVIKTIPLGESSEVVLSTFWIDLTDFVVRKVEISTKVNGTFTINLNYNTQTKFKQLPSSIIFSFNVSKLNIPKRFSGQEENNKADSSSTMGKVFIEYSNYKVNQGLPDSLFEEKKKQSESDSSH